MSEDLAFIIQFYESLLKRCPGYVEVIERLGHLYTLVGRIDEGLKMDRKLVRLQPENPISHYNLACSLALKGRKREAVEALRKSLDCGYQDYGWVRKDPDLKQLHAYLPFQKLLKGRGCPL